MSGVNFSSRLHAANNTKLRRASLHVARPDEGAAQRGGSDAAAQSAANVDHVLLIKLRRKFCFVSANKSILINRKAVN